MLVYEFYEAWQIFSWKLLNAVSRHLNAQDRLQRQIAFEMFEICHFKE